MYFSFRPVFSNEHLLNLFFQFHAFFSFSLFVFRRSSRRFVLARKPPPIERRRWVRVVGGTCSFVVSSFRYRFLDDLQHRSFEIRFRSAQSPHRVRVFHLFVFLFPLWIARPFSAVSSSPLHVVRRSLARSLRYRRFVEEQIVEVRSVVLPPSSSVGNILEFHRHHRRRRQSLWSSKGVLRFD